MLIPHHLNPPPPLSRVLVTIGNYKKKKTPFSWFSLEIFPRLRPKTTPLSQENGNAHPAPLCIWVGGLGSPSPSPYPSSSLFVCLFQFSLYRVALSVYITVLPRDSVDGVSAGAPPHRVFTLLFMIEYDGFFNMQRMCLSFTRDLHIMSYPMDGVFSTAPACIWKQKGRRDNTQHWLQFSCQIAARPESSCRPSVP